MRNFKIMKIYKANEKSKIVRIKFIIHTFDQKGGNMGELRDDMFSFLFIIYFLETNFFIFSFVLIALLIN